MPSGNRIKLFRSLERVTLLLILIWTGGLSAWYVTSGLDKNELIAGGGILAMMLAVRWFIQRNIDERCVIAFSQSNYAHDDAFAALFERSPVAYLIIDTKGVILETNAAAIKLLRTETEIITRTNFFSRIDAAEGIDPSMLQGKVRAGITVYDVEVPIMTFTGEQIWVILSTFSYRSGKQRLLAMVDVTEQKHIDTAKSEFVALATHQLRTPIAAIRWNVELLRKNLADTATEEQVRYISKVERNVHRMINLINDFLSVSKLEMGTYASTEENLDLSDFFASIIDEYTGKITEKQIQLNQEELPPHVIIKTDTRLFHIIVSNLVSNAVKYLNVQGTLELSYQLHGQTLTVVVADDGIGVPEGEVGKLFTKFYRASNAQSHQTEGTGLGLYIVKQSVDLLDGQIEVESKEDQGARFSIVLPVKVVSIQEIG
jgi:PAS domain S-box-containing protein